MKERRRRNVVLLLELLEYPKFRSISSAVTVLFTIQLYGKPRGYKQFHSHKNLLGWLFGYTREKGLVKSQDLVSTLLFYYSLSLGSTALRRHPGLYKPDSKNSISISVRVNKKSFIWKFKALGLDWL